MEEEPDNEVEEEEINEQDHMQSRELVEQAVEEPDNEEEESSEPVLMSTPGGLAQILTKNEPIVIQFLVKDGNGGKISSIHMTVCYEPGKHFVVMRAN